MKIVGLKQKDKVLPDEYYRLSELQKTLYRICTEEFQKALIRIENATELLKVRERTINKSKVARLAALELNKSELNHSHMSKNNCQFLFNSINVWNSKLDAAFLTSTAYRNSNQKSPTKEDLKAEIKELKKPKKSIGRDVYDYYVQSCLLDSESELKTMIDKLQTENVTLREKLTNSQLHTDTLINQLTQAEGQVLQIKRLQREVRALQELLIRNGIDFDK